MNFFTGATLNCLHNLFPLKLTGEASFSLVIFAGEVIMCMRGSYSNLGLTGNINIRSHFLLLPNNSALLHVRMFVRRLSLILWEYTGTGGGQGSRDGS